jgi:NADH-quinone oxidoreductase subunit M
MLIRAIHNRPGPRVTSRDIGLRDGLVLVPLVLAILAFALYPQAALVDSEPSVGATLNPPEQVAAAGESP